MAEYIDKNTTVGILEAMSRSANCECIKKRLEKAAKRVNTMPAADVAPVRHGRWETHSDRPDSLICSVCKCGFDMWKHDPHNYCPNCGAKMDGELNE